MAAVCTEQSRAEEERTEHSVRVRWGLPGGLFPGGREAACPVWGLMLGPQGLSSRTDSRVHESEGSVFGSVFRIRG